jgi:primosomal protein N' (replication factor Y)
MGSATPSLEANYRAQQGIYRKYRLETRIGDASLPQMTVVDMKQELREGNTSVLSTLLQQKIDERLTRGEQTMLFLNRRGTAGFLSCRACGYVPKCPHCDVSLSQHGNRLVCHYCNHTQAKPQQCPSCGSKYIFGFKAGTEKIEEIVRNRFPQARILRMDADTTRKKGDYERILSAFANEEADILIGTQMIVKGHDFKKVSLVGVLAADTSLAVPDYRAGERTFQLLVQAAGRAGRGQIRGEAVIQTYQPSHYSIVHSLKQDYDAFYREELLYRELMEYPPVSHMLALLVTGKEERTVQSCARALGERVTAEIQKDGQKDGVCRLRCIGPAPAAIGKINDLYRYVLYLKCAQQQALVSEKDRLEAVIEEKKELFSGVTVSFDMDPVGGY